MPPWIVTTASACPEQVAQPLCQVVEGVAVLAEDDQLAPLPISVKHGRVGLQQIAQLFPLAVGAAQHDLPGQPLQLLQAPDLQLQFGNRASSRGLVHHLLFLLQQLCFRRIFQVVPVFAAQAGQVAQELHARCGAALEQLLFAHPALQPFAASAQRLVDRFRRGGQARAAGWSGRSRPCRDARGG